MLAIQEDRLKQVKSFHLQNGDDKTVKQFGISHETLKRYLREYRIKFRETPETRTELTLPKVLLLDIETAPMEVFTWGLWKQNINTIQIQKDWCMLTWSCKWLMEADIYSGQITPAEALERYDKRITEEIWKFVEDADVVIAHNGMKFDLKRLNTRFIQHGLTPPLSYQVIDTLKVVKRKFSFTSNRLDYLGKIFGFGGKIETGFELWKNVLTGDQKAIDQMAEYNRRDVTLLEEVYLKIRPWMPSHPNMGLFVDASESMCPACYSTDLTWKGAYNTLVARYSSFRCNHCGAIGRARKTSLSKEKSQSLVTSVAR